MKIVAIIGSLRKQSYNRAVFEAYREIAMKEADISEGRYEEFPLYNQDVQDGGFPPAVSQLAEQIRAADGVLFFSPEYNYSVPGAMKNALDWLSRVENQPFNGKAASILGASPGKLGTARMQYHLRQIGVFLNLSFMNRPEIMISEAHKQINEQGLLTDPKTKQHLQGHWEAFREFVRIHQKG